MDVPQVADYSRVSKTSVYKLIERQKIPAIRIGRPLKAILLLANQSRLFLPV